MSEHNLVGIQEDTATIAALQRRIAELEDKLEEREVTLQQNLDLFQKFLDFSPTIMYAKDREGRHILVNRQFEHFFEAEVGSLLGKKDEQLLPKDSASYASYYDQLVMETGAPVQVEDVLPRGSECRNYITVKFPIYDAQGTLYAIGGIATDITDRVQLRQQTEQQLRRVQALRTIDHAINMSLDLPLTLSVLLHQVLTHLHVDAAAVLLFNTTTYTLDYAAGQGFHTDSITYSSLRLGECYAGRAALERCVVSVADIRQEGGFSRTELLEWEGIKGYYGVPLIAKGKVKGVLELYLRSPFMPDQEWLDFLSTLSGQAAIAIDNAELVRELQRSNTDLMLAYDTTIEGWARALELRDVETVGHSRRVTEMTLKLAMHAGFSKEELVHVRRGALLHDIGKMAIPDSILLKPGALTDEEFLIMQQHTTYAYNLLLPIPFLRPALDIPYCHHEKWDGTGYPRGLRGEDIPFAARIFAVIDVYDALCSNRPYRKGWKKGDVCSYIQAESGKHFDPDVVDLFYAFLQCEKIAQDYHDEQALDTVSMLNLGK
jgi:PAS domain S-box-containing protein